ncbi:MAG: aminotransferase class I/II-fold pyridoxal phosphate-dependent enzyme, partial [Actinobacteria bacterium]|nr:aminotransferase class I/II-fold pyridoxal phosphate-dependent enzyme [Actinomycetota bacterium]
MDLARGIPGVIHLEIGEPIFPTPHHIKDAAHRAALEGFTKYAPNAGMASLRELIVKKLKTVNGLDYTPDNVVVTIGGVGGIATSVLALVESYRPAR